MLVLHEKPDAGSIVLDGMDVIKMLPEQLCGFRPQMQLMHQDASTSFNPRFNAVECVEEPLLIKGVKQIDRHKLALESMELSGLTGQFADRSPLELSRGQRQRLAIARVLVLKPKLIIFDESLSGLDLLTQSHIVRLLLDLRQRYDLTYVFISHDLSLMGDIAERIAVMKDGGIVEEQESTHLFSAPQHVETCKLLSAVPRMSQPREPGHRLALQEGSL
jgi:ABC-type dipeptide/oligopeptide/nickel transport system ATPase subunit